MPSRASREWKSLASFQMSAVPILPMEERASSLHMRCRNTGKHWADFFSPRDGTKAVLLLGDFDVAEALAAHGNRAVLEGACIGAKVGRGGKQRSTQTPKRVKSHMSCTWTTFLTSARSVASLLVLLLPCENLVCLATVPCPPQAAQAYDKVATRHHWPAASLNFRGKTSITVGPSVPESAPMISGLGIQCWFHRCSTKLRRTCNAQQSCQPVPACD